VLGLASPEDRAEFEKLCVQYPELVDARERFEIELEQKLVSESISVPGGVKEKVMEAIQQSENQTKIITMESRNTSRSSSPLRWVAAASVILLIGAAAMAYKFYSENRELKDASKNLEARANDADSMRTILNGLEQVIKNPNVAVVNMIPTAKSQATASIYWDSTSANVYMVVKNMPKLPSDKQYQLWALIDGKPKDLGLFDVGNEKVILKMNNTQKADAFAITIENRGNTGGPNLEQLQNMGKAKL